jgi:hypothetical protein
VLAPAFIERYVYGICTHGFFFVSKRWLWKDYQDERCRHGNTISNGDVLCRHPEPIMIIKTEGPFLNLLIMVDLPSSVL